MLSRAGEIERLEKEALQLGLRGRGASEEALRKSVQNIRR